MGDVPKSTDTTQCKPSPPPKPASTALVLTTLKDLTTRLTQLEEKHAKLEQDHTQLRSDHFKLETESKKWQQKVAELKVYLHAFQADHGKIFTEQSDLKQVQDNMQSEINNIRTEQQAQFSEMTEAFAQKSDIVTAMTSLREEMTSQSRDMASVKDTSSAQQGHTELHTLQSDLSQQKEDNNKLQTEVTKIHAHCSKLETDQNNMKAEMDNLQVAQTKLTTNMDRISTDQETFQADMAKMQKDHVDTVLAEQRQLQQNQDTLASDVDTVKTDVEQMKTSLGESLTKAGSDIKALKTTLGKARQLFDTIGQKATSPQSQAMIYEGVTINEGGYLNEETGVFTAPHAGLYFFTVTVASDTKDASVYGRIMVDDDWHCVVHGGNGGGSGCLMVPLTAGQTVWVQLRNLGDLHDMYCWFKGTLVLTYP